LFNLKI